MGGEEEAPAKGPGLDLERLARGILKRFWLAAGIAFVVATLFLVAAVTLVESRWQALAAVMLHRQEEFSLGAAKPFEPESYNLKTLLDTVKLPSSLQAVSEELNLGVPIRTLSPAIGVNIGKDSDIFQITAIWNDPVIAARIANTVVEHLVQRSRDLRRADAEEAHANYSEQLVQAREDLRSVVAEMRAFKTEHQFSSLAAETQVLVSSLSTLETERNTKLAELQAYNEARADLERLIEQEPEMVVSSTIYRNPLKSRLTDYEWQLQEARSRYTEKNPKVIKLQTRVDVLKQMIADSEDEGAPENQYTANTRLADLEARKRELIEEIGVREAQLVALEETIEKSRAKLLSLNAAEKEFRLLQARIVAAENLVQGLVGRVDEAEVVIQRNEAALALFEAATPPELPMPSPKKLIAMAGVVLGGGLGLGVALLLELLDPRLRTRRDALGMPDMDLAWEFQQLPSANSGCIDIRRPVDPVADLYRRIINELDTQLEPDDWRCLGIVSAEPEVGRSLTATNLALTLALKERPVILVDADLRSGAGARPSALLGLDDARVGLRQALEGEGSLTGLPTGTEIADFRLIAAGMAPSGKDDAAADIPASDVDAAGADASSLGLAILGSRRFGHLLDALRQSGCHLIYDLPPLDGQEPILEAAVALGSVLVVARSGQTTRGELRETVELLQERGARVCGILVTDVPINLLSGKPLFRPEPRRWFGLRRARATATA
ncbi:GumC family protein [Thiohalocapsa marina]|nr:hypothetical protein [Thiohalocapsa marina]